jgi:large subunit ribosomal protein L13e
MVRHNNVIPNGHFHKKWQERVKTWFGQPGQKKARRLRRIKKAAKIAPRPLNGLLRPAVRCPTLKYNMKLRKGRGFTLAELREAGLCPKAALGIGIAVDHRRRNTSLEQFRLNVLRLKEYKSRLVLFPRRGSRIKLSDDQLANLQQATQLKGDLMPIRQTYELQKGRAITEKEHKTTVFYKLRQARATSRLVGIMKKKREERDQMVKSA